MKQNVLVVEENISICYLLSTVLRKKFRVFTHTDCYNALKSLKKEDIDLIIINVEDTGTKNYDFLMHLHFSGFYSNIPVIVTSDNNTAEFRLACSELSIEAFYLKPFDPLSLLNTIKDILDFWEDIIQVKKNKGTS